MGSMSIRILDIVESASYLVVYELLLILVKISNLVEWSPPVVLDNKYEKKNIHLLHNGYGILAMV